MDRCVFAACGSGSGTASTCKRMAAVRTAALDRPGQQRRASILSKGCMELKRVYASVHSVPSAGRLPDHSSLCSNRQAHREQCNGVSASAAGGFAGSVCSRGNGVKAVGSILTDTMALSNKQKREDCPNEKHTGYQGKNIWSEVGKV